MIKHDKERPDSRDKPSITSSTIAEMGKNMAVSMEVLEKYVRHWIVTLGDILMRSKKIDLSTL